GVVIVALPVDGVLSTSVERLWPPSVEYRIRTLAQFTAVPAPVLTAFHLTIFELLFAHTSPPCGSGTRNGPALPSTPTRTTLLATPPFVWLSRAVKRKFSA